jgi:membrane associated rhomboid family serine protease
MVPIPLHDHIRRQIVPVLTFALIAANVLAFFAELWVGPHIDQVVFLLGIIPARYTVPQIAFQHTPSELVVPFFASMFLHGGWLHLLGNMLFLFVFGRSIEDRFGHLRFLLIYFLGGLAGALVHIFLNPGSRVPTIGASGAIAGVLGAYFISYPRARITTLVPILFLFWTIEVPALVLLGYWFLIQFFTGFQMQAIETATAGGEAWWAHVGGFVAGFLLALILRPKRRRVMEVVQL